MPTGPQGTPLSALVKVTGRRYSTATASSWADTSQPLPRVVTALPLHWPVEAAALTMTVMLYRWGLARPVMVRLVALAVEQ